MSELGDDIDLFQEPDDFFQPVAQPTFASHTLISGEQLDLRLVGHNPLWVRGSLVTSQTPLEERKYLYTNR
jgi:hypothetical protein